MQYHPDNPPWSTFQSIWQKYILEPEGNQPLPSILNKNGNPIRIDQMTIAYIYPSNLGTIVSPCIINSFNDPLASSFQITSQEGI